MTERIRYRLWHLICRLKKTCPAQSHSVIVSGGYHRSERWQACQIDSSCRRDLDATGSCWCGKLQHEGTVVS